jgi:hypothetical protein
MGGGEKFLVLIGGPFFIISSPPNFHLVYVNVFGKVVLKVNLLGEKAVGIEHSGLV